MTEFRQWGWFHSMTAAHDAVDRMKPGRVRYERRGSGQVEVLVAVAGSAPPTLSPLGGDNVHADGSLKPIDCACNECMNDEVAGSATPDQEVVLPGGPTRLPPSDPDAYDHWRKDE